MHVVDLELSKQHFSTKVYKAYFHYIRNHFPSINIAALCEKAGLPYEYILNEGNWVSVIFDERLTRLMIEATSEPELCYNAGKQQVNEEVMGRVIYFTMRHAVSIQLVFSQLPQLTSLFTKVTKIEKVEEKKSYLHIRLMPVTEGLTAKEIESLGGNLSNIFQNTIGHYSALPSCQDLPQSQIEYKESMGVNGLPVYDIYIHFVTLWKTGETAGIAFSLLISLLIEWLGSKMHALGSNIHWLVGSWFFVSMTSIGISKYIALKKGFSVTIQTLNNMDGRFVELYRGKQQFERLSSSYRRFVPQEFLKLLGREDVLDIKLGDSVEMEVTILFSDIRNFTMLSEKMAPRENFLFLNSYLERISPCIRRNGGFIDKYIGDGIMAIFPRSPKDAILASIAMIQELRIYNGHRASVGYSPVAIGIGLNTGKVILGTIGNPEQMNGTVISDCVNVAARIEEMTKQFNSSIIVTEASLRRSGLYGSVASRRLGKFFIRGKTEPEDIQEIYEGETQDIRELHSRTKDVFEKGVRLFEDQVFAAAKKEFQQVLQVNPSDKAAQYFLRHSEEADVPQHLAQKKAG